MAGRVAGWERQCEMMTKERLTDMYAREMSDESAPSDSDDGERVKRHEWGETHHTLVSDASVYTFGRYQLSGGAYIARETRGRVHVGIRARQGRVKISLTGVEKGDIARRRMHYPNNGGWTNHETVTEGDMDEWASYRAEARTLLHGIRDI